MQNYVNLVKNLYQTGQGYLTAFTDSGSTKAAIVKIDKATTVYEARQFNSSQIDTVKCIKTLTHLIYLFNQGETFTQNQANELFFSITKLLQTEDAPLRRVVYMIIKEMRKQPSIYIVTSSLLKDIHHKNPNFRRNSLRTIPLVIDPSNLAQVERYIKGLIADPDAGVSSGALLSGIQMFLANQEMVRKWGNQITEKLSSKDQFLQYQALILLGDTKKKDINSLKKTLLALMKQNMVGIAAVQHLRMLRQLMKQLDYDSPEATEITNYLNRMVRSSEDIVVIEACKLACQSPFMSNKDLLQVVKILEPFLVSESTVKKYSVLKIFNQLLKTQSRKSLIVNVKQIEKVLNGKNTSLSSIAASILLRICSEAYLQTLFQRIEKTMFDMSNEYKIDVVKSLVNVLKTYPKQYVLINQFLLNIMSKESALEIKSEAIEVMNFQIAQIGGPAKTQCIRYLAKYLSSTNYQRIHFQILGIISRQATREDISSEIFKNIISEIYLQQGAVRACGLSTLMRLSEHEERKRADLERTISKFKDDHNQQVRDRLTFRAKPEPISNYELDLIENYLNFNCKQIQNSSEADALSISTIKKWGSEVGPSIIGMKKPVSQTEKQKVQTQQEMKYRQIFMNHPNFKDYGPLRKINKTQQIADADGELQVGVRIFLFDSNLVAEFSIENKIHSSVLENVKIQLKHSGEMFEVVHIIPAKSIAYSQSGECYVGLAKQEECEDLLPEQKFSAIAKYTVKEMSGDTVKTTYPDEFSLQDFQIKLSTFMSPWVVEPTEFAKIWEQMNGYQQNGTFQLKYASTQAAEKQLVKHFGIKIIDNPESKNSNMVSISLAGKYLGIHSVLLVLILAFDTKMGCLLKIKVKTDNEDLTNELLQSIS